MLKTISVLLYLIAMVVSETTMNFGGDLDAIMEAIREAEANRNRTENYRIRRRVEETTEIEVNCETIDRQQGKCIRYNNKCDAIDVLRESVTSIDYSNYYYVEVCPSSLDICCPQ